MLPAPVSLMWGTAYLTPRKMDLASTPISKSQRSSVTSSALPVSGPCAGLKALLTRMSRRPQRSTARSIMRRMSSWLPTSARVTSAGAARVAYALGVGVGGVQVYVRYKRFRALFGELSRRRAADAERAAGYDGDLSL